MDKLLTIIIPTYNMEMFLKRCLDSLLLDDMTLLGKLEVLIINDGSKDSSSKIAHNYSEQHPCVFKVIDKENGNYGSCINAGLKVATGKYVKILDADDWFDNNQFLIYVKVLTSLDSDLVLTNIRQVSSSRMLSETKMPDNLRGKEFSLEELRFNEDKIIPLVAMHSITIKKDILTFNNESTCKSGIKLIKH